MTPNLMRLHRLYLRNVRNHVSTELLAADRVNLITGMNGRGKTSILEAISLCTLTRSFDAANDSALLRRGEEVHVKFRSSPSWLVGIRRA